MAKNNKTLFIGGPLDGKRKDWHAMCPQAHTSQVQVASFPQSNAAMSPVMPMDTISMRTDTYQLRKFGTAEVAVHSSVADILTQLVRGYRYHRNPRLAWKRKMPDWLRTSIYAHGP